MIIIRKLIKEDFIQIHQSFNDIGWSKPISLFEQYFNEQEKGQRVCFIALSGDIFAGYATLLNKSKYENFANNNIPEISDLNVLRKFQNQGIGTLLIKECEKIAKITSNKVGLGVGLTSDYANAFRLYLKLGYLLDGNGLASNGKILKYNETAVVNDELNLYLIKIL
ncbi:GNAT family N-acetyltransferase [Candidatus Deianiraea vastatrix]|uniref:GNAT family N-acetyltransferase n=1 Tax=Candidatus Deianiraea vastatrix TaxID=2163644 RepID=A0A5B8XCX3_9RICK|nr:GNAT family N-acetyltransferase [Candidatus Deianiraea vastatrix]QED23172.1 GNAT family N-acetyltransferase [Candidatus Deianiraea vastatrix]